MTQASGEKMHRLGFSVIALLAVIAAPAQGADSSQTWYFATSGDSRNCGDVIMPAIAADALKHKVAFYLHLGDLRKISAPDEDFIQEQALKGTPADLAYYESHAWDNFIEEQIKPWGETPFYVGIGNHETTPPKSRAALDRKSTRLNSSHSQISYAVFCLKKNEKTEVAAFTRVGTCAAFIC